MWSVVCARNPITIGSNPVYLINETNIEKGGDAITVHMLWRTFDPIQDLEQAPGFCSGYESHPAISGNAAADPYS